MQLPVGQLEPSLLPAVVSLSKKWYPLCLALVGPRKGYKTESFHFNFELK